MKKVVVCIGSSCHLKGSRQVVEELQKLIEQNNLKEEIEKLKITSGSKFFNKLNQKDFPERDFYLCTEINKFDFVLNVKKDLKGNLYIEKINS